MAMIVWVITGILAGWLTGLLIRNTSLGAVGDLVLGALGGLIGGYLGSAFWISPTDWFASVSTAATGSVIFVWILHAVHPGVTTPL